MTARKTGKGVDHQRIILGVAQENPSLSSPLDFEILEDPTPPFHGHCGDDEGEYERLLRKGREGNKKEFTPLDKYGRQMAASKN